MRANISICDFDFRIVGHGHYRVTYTSPVTFKTWTAVTDDMTLIDATKNADAPLIKDLKALKRVCKS
jgi:hypothetical protein